MSLSLRQKMWWPLCVAAVLLAAGLSCSQQDQAQLQTQMAIVGETSVAIAKTESPPLQTQVARAAQTAVAEGLKIAGTEAAHVKETAVAELATQLATLSSPAQTVTPTPKKQPIIDYFALGDSLASGHGLKDDETLCRRSDRSYPHKVVELLKTRYVEVNELILACSGATAGRPDDEAMLRKEPYKWLRNQVDDVVANLSERPTLVSLTIGANDFGWGDLKKIGPHLSEQGDIFINWVSAVSSGIEAELIMQVSRMMKNHPNVVVVITEVPNPFNTESTFFTWTVVGPITARPCKDTLGTLDCYQRTHYLINGLNNAYYETVYALKQPAGLGIAGKITAK